MLKNILQIIGILSFIVFCISIVIIFPLTNQVEISSPIIITNSNVTISDSIITLKDKSDCPVLIIGSESGLSISNIVISNLEINGNRIGQTKELWKKSKYGVINNDGILIQNAHNIILTNIVIRNCKSGGLVTTLGVKNLIVYNLTSINNEYDGIALYKTTDSYFNNLILRNNLAAAISLDNSFNFNTFSNCLIIKNNTSIFMRDCTGNKFLKLFLSGNRHDIFIAQVNNDTNTGSYFNSFDLKMSTASITVNNKSCLSNTIVIDKN